MRSPACVGYGRDRSRRRSKPRRWRSSRAGKTSNERPQTWSAGVSPACRAGETPALRSVEIVSTRFWIVVGIHIGQGVGLNRQGGQFARTLCRGGTARLAHQVGEILGIEMLRVLFRGNGGRDGIAGAEVDAELETGDGHLVVGEQGGAADAGAVDTRAVRAAEVADEQQAIGLDEDTVQFRDTLVIQAQVAVFLAADEDKILVEFNRLAAFEWNELGTHGWSHRLATCRTGAPRSSSGWKDGFTTAYHRSHSLRAIQADSWQLARQLASAGHTAATGRCRRSRLLLASAQLALEPGGLVSLERRLQWLGVVDALSVAPPPVDGVDHGLEIEAHVGIWLEERYPNGGQGLLVMALPNEAGVRLPGASDHQGVRTGRPPIEHGHTLAAAQQVYLHQVHALQHQTLPLAEVEIAPGAAGPLVRR